ncbi:capsular biosynthesis protein [Sphingobium sp. SCG-1]|uniref:capsule biosynthesis protein n=1 Tax=Sphingobium sp. SCG-1 TaxID=2072936 RepID=UPI000CD693F1|nr:capsular biosynthesis protein [Sphingobium sp. SCG-1]AUW58713.1 capsular biosynthesis protein [Sphingobium sp. SCG-1]
MAGFPHAKGKPQLRSVANDAAPEPAATLEGRVFVMLQGPPGPFFWLLGKHMRELGATVHRINFNGGDRVDWPGEGAVDFRGAPKSWPRFFDHFLRDNGVTDVMLFGDCRPLHRAAHGMAKLRNVNIHVFEEGYIRPDWVTMEVDGVNGHSTLPRDPEWFLEQAKTLPPVPNLPPITASFDRRVRDSYRYFHHVVTQFWRFPHYRSHRPGSVLIEGVRWGWKLVVSNKTVAQRTARALAQIKGRKYFLFPLQLTSDYQIREHSPFPDMASAVHYVFDSFQRHAPAGTMLLVKEHPLDAGTTIWSQFVKTEAERRGLAGRIVHIAGGDLAELAAGSSGMITVNSTSGSLALTAQVPVVVLGDAIYDVAGLTHQGPLDDYWTGNACPDQRVWQAFRQVLHARCLVRGGFASESAVATLVTSVVSRILDGRPSALYHSNKWKA